jgi:branched-chain amino acid transport system ATP-binding protein
VPTSTDALLAVSDLSVNYSGQPALRSVSVAVGEGESVGVVGANGAGKSTLARAIAGLVRPAGGQVSSHGVTLTGMRADKVVRHGVAFVPEGRALFTRLTVLDNMLLGGYTLPGTSEAVALAHVEGLFPELLDRKLVRAGQLSGGQQQMLAIARALMSKPRLLILDEPTMGLAPIIITRLANALNQLREQEGLAVLILDQRRTLAERLEARGYILRGGRVVAEVGRGQWDDPALAQHYMAEPD